MAFSTTLGVLFLSSLFLLYWSPLPSPVPTSHHLHPALALLTHLPESAGTFPTSAVIRGSMLPSKVSKLGSTNKWEHVEFIFLGVGKAEYLSVEERN